MERVRAIGAEALTDPIFHAARLGCIAPFPRWWYRLPASDPDGRVQLVHHGDLPAGHPALSDLGRMGAAPGLRALVLAGSPLLQWQAPASLVDSSRLVHLDLAGCGLDHLPAFVLRTAALEVLRVDNNPLFDLAVLLHPDELPRLRGLGIGGTLLGPAFRERLRVARPGLRLLDEPAA